jgi:hypothetical protein
MDNSIVDCGLIKRRDGLIGREEWDKLVESHPGLEQVEDRYGTSPFTGEKVLFSGKNTAYCIVDGKRQGTLQFGKGSISITEVPERFCNEMAALLKAEVRPGMDAYSEE